MTFIHSHTHTTHIKTSVSGQEITPSIIDLRKTFVMACILYFALYGIVDPGFDASFRTNSENKHLIIGLVLGFYFFVLGV